MVIAWTKQFLLATGLFAVVLTGQTLNLILKEKRLAQKQLEVAERTVRVTTTTSHMRIN